MTENEYEVSVVAYQHLTVTAESKEEAEMKARHEALSVSSMWEYKDSHSHKLD